MSIMVCSTLPTFYSTRRRTIYSYSSRTGKTSGTSLVGWARKAQDLSPVVVKILSKLLPKLSELSISFRLYEPIIERDVEIPNWKYAVIDIGLDWRGNPAVFDKLCDYLIDYSYGFLSAEEATKVLVQFNHV